MPYPTIYGRIKKLLAAIANVNPERIKAKMLLAGPPLRFTATGLRALAQALNDTFKMPPMKRAITREQTAQAKSVQSLADLVREAYE